MILHPFNFLYLNKIKRVVLKSNFLFFFWTPTFQSYNLFYTNKLFLFLNIKIFFLKSLLKFYYKDFTFLKNFCSLLYSYKNYKLLLVLNSLKSKSLIFCIYKKFLFVSPKTQLTKNSYSYLKTISLRFLISGFSLNLL